MTDWATRLRGLVDGALDAVLPPESIPPQALHGAMRYAVFPGGKRVRPLLALAAALAASRRMNGPGHDGEATVRRTMPCAVAVELVHSYSLIHDDLPAMDNDDLRRGRPTVHRAFGEALALLAGDALLPLAFEVLSAEEARRLMGPEAAAATVHELAHAAGSLGMAGGQAVDIAGATSGARPPRPEEVEGLADLKTGALIRAAVRCGAIAAGAGQREFYALTRYAELFGRAFQVFDDLRDMAEDGAATFPRAMGTDEARRYGDGLLAGAEDALSLFAGDAAELSDLAASLALGLA